MNKASWRLLLLGVFLLPGCGKGPGGLPYDAWHLGFLAPSYMDVWIETADVVDSRGRLFREAGWGTASIRNSPDLKLNPRGWSQQAGYGKGKHVRGATLPKWVYIHWQSLVEPQTYEVLIPIDEATRKAMATGEKTFCHADAKWITDYRNGLGIGLAPGGIAQAWITGPCLEKRPVARVQARVVEPGPYEGLSGGHYYPLDDVSRAYIDKYGIPYGSW